MSTTILAGARGDPARVQAGFRHAEACVRQLEARFTRFDEQSELCDLNRSGGDWYIASAEMFEVVQLAYKAYRDTAGLFNPAVLAALEYAGYDQSIEVRDPGSARSLAMEKTAIVIPDFAGTRFDRPQQGILLPAGLRLDLGGIAKGWIAEQAALLLRQYSDACVIDAGGDLFAIDSPAGGEPWSIGLEDPFDPTRDLAVLHIHSGAVATSAVTRRRWQVGGQEYHHIIDPRTGLPAEAFWASVSVTADHTADAEVLAKALLIAGPAGAPALLSRHPEAVYIAVDQHRQIWGSPNAEEVLDARFARV